MNLYRPDKYKFLTGEKTNTALCTCWFDPSTVLPKYPKIIKTFNIVGTLYSIALQLGVPFQQDKPLEVANFRLR